MVIVGASNIQFVEHELHLSLFCQCLSIKSDHLKFIRVWLYYFWPVGLAMGI